VGVATAVLVTLILSVDLLPRVYEVHEGDVAAMTIKASRKQSYVSQIRTKQAREAFAGGPHLDPAPALAVGGVAHLLESEVLQVEGLGPVLVADRYRDDLDAKLRDGKDPLVRR